MKKGRSKVIWNEVLFLLINIILWGYLYWRQCVYHDVLDYHAHNLFAQLIMDGKMQLAYPGYHYLVGILAKVLGMKTTQSSVIVLVAAQLSIMYITAMILKTIFQSWNNRISLLWCSFLLNIVQPIFTYSIKPGYSSGNGLVSPTLTLCKPFALLSILIFYKAYTTKDWSVKYQISLTCALVVSCIFKPLFAMAFVPAIGLLLFIDELNRLFHKESTISKSILQLLVSEWPLLITGIVLIIQYVMSSRLEAPTGLFEGIRVSVDSSTHIRFGYMHAWSMVVSNVYLSILMAFLFPITVLIQYMYARFKAVEERNLIPNQDFKGFFKMSCYYGVVSFCYIAFLYQDNGYETDMNFRNAWVFTFTMMYISAFIVLWQQMKKQEYISKFRNIHRDGLIVFLKENLMINIQIVILAVHVLFGIMLIGKNIIL